MSNMSKIMEKTLSVIPSLITSSMKGKDVTQAEFTEQDHFIKKLAACNSSKEEDNIVQEQLVTERERLSNPHITIVERNACLTRLLYCFLLGYDISFAYIHCVKLAQQRNVFEKRVGYLLCSTFLDDADELSVLLINTIQKDLKSTNIIDVYSALNAASHLVGKDMIQVVLPMVVEKTVSEKEIIRKKAVICLHSFHRKAPEIILPLEQYFQKTLCDRDPGVVWATIQIYLDLVKNNEDKYRPMVQLLCDIVMQIINRKLPVMYDYQSVPAPWLTIDLLKLLAILGHKCEKTSVVIYPVINEVLQRTEPTKPIGLAIILECVDTVCKIWPHEELLEHAAKCVTKFLSAKNVNLKYLGLQSLQNLVSIDPSFALNHQQILIECLEHGDKTLQIQTFNILQEIANPSNIAVISKKLIQCLEKTSENNTKKDLVSKLLNLCNRYKNDIAYSEKTEWYVAVVNELINTAAKDLLPNNYVEQVVGVINNKSHNVHKTAVNIYWSQLQKNDLDSQLIQLAVWILSKFWNHLNLECDQQKASLTISNCLLSWLPKSSDCETKRAVLQALLRILPHVPQEQVLLYIQSIESSVQPDNDKHILQILKEIKALSEYKSVFATALCEVSPEKMDFSLSFLDDFVCDALENGSVPYKPPSLHNLKTILGAVHANVDIKGEFIGKNTQFKNNSSHHSQGQLSSSVVSLNSQDTKESFELKLSGVKQIWGKNGKKSTNENKKLNNVSEKAMESSKEKTELQEALFSGIMSPISKDHKYKFEKFTATKNIRKSNKTVADENTLTMSQTISSQKDISPLALQTNPLLSTLEIEPQSRSYINSENKVANPVSKFSPSLNDIETDSLDGSPDYSDCPPVLFHSDEYSENMDSTLSSQPLQSSSGFQFPGISSPIENNEVLNNFTLPSLYNQDVKSTENEIDKFIASVKKN